MGGVVGIVRGDGGGGRGALGRSSGGGAEGEVRGVFQVLLDGGGDFGVGGDFERGAGGVYQGNVFGALSGWQAGV